MTRTASQVTLREITADTVRAVTDLAVADTQRVFVAANAISLAEALFSREAWYRAICSADEIAGFVMLYDESLRPDPPPLPELWVWRLMVDSKRQGRGIGRAAMELIIAHATNKRVAPLLQVSFVPAASGSPEDFYLSLGFRHTGRLQDGEVVLELPLARTAG
jgi:diamine N-acetyltransferase